MQQASLFLLSGLLIAFLFLICQEFWAVPTPGVVPFLFKVHHPWFIFPFTHFFELAAMSVSPQCLEGGLHGLNETFPEKPDNWRALPPPAPPPPPLTTWPSFPHMCVLLTTCFLIARWFYNLFLRVGGFSWHQWAQRVTKLVVPSTCFSPSPFADTFDKDNPLPKHRRPRVRSTPPPFSLKRGLMLAMTLFGQTAHMGATFQLESEQLSQQHLRKFRSPKGALNPCKLDATDLATVQDRIRGTNACFQAATGGSPHTFSAICDSGCSHSCTPCKDDFLPGTLQRLEAPLTLGGGAGDLTIEWQ